MYSIIWHIKKANQKMVESTHKSKRQSLTKIQSSHNPPNQTDLISPKIQKKTSIKNTKIKKLTIPFQIPHQKWLQKQQNKAQLKILQINLVNDVDVILPTNQPPKLIKQPSKTPNPINSHPKSKTDLLKKVTKIYYNSFFPPKIIIQIRWKTDDARY